ncbi:TPA: hypothetical protein ACGXK0_003557 [Bacillus cereus]|nr:hypothetical protein [Bacillus cereus]
MASKYTDLADGGEIFVTNHFYTKLPVSEKVDENGDERWQPHYRIKGNAIFEGYVIADYYVEQQSEEQNKEQRSTSEVAASFLERKHVSERTIDGINQGEIITNIIEGVRKQTSDLLERFESVIHRERDFEEKEADYRKREQVLVTKEQTLAQKEEELSAREERMKQAVERQKIQATYEVKKAFFGDNINSYPLEEALKQMEELKILGEKLGKTSAEYKNDLYYWRLVRYFKDKEITIAYRMIIEQLQNKLGYISLPHIEDVVTIVKKLGKQQEYLQVVRYFIRTYKPKAKLILELKTILRGLGLEHQLTGTSSLLEHQSN